MKKLFIIAIAACTLVACKSKEDVYRNAYDNARQSELAEGDGQQSTPVDIAPVVSTTTASASTQNVDDSYRTERVVLSSGTEGSLKAFSVVCGSFSSKSNADNLRATLIDEGYNAIVVQNPETNMYRVICASYDNKMDAAQARAQFKASHPNNTDFQKAWLLYNR